MSLESKEITEDEPEERRAGRGRWVRDFPIYCPEKDPSIPIEANDLYGELHAIACDVVDKHDALPDELRYPAFSVVFGVFEAFEMLKAGNFLTLAEKVLDVGQNYQILLMRFKWEPLVREGRVIDEGRKAPRSQGWIAVKQLWLRNRDITSVQARLAFQKTGENAPATFNEDFRKRRQKWAAKAPQ